MDYVFADIDANSKATITYLDEKSATKYSVQGFKGALSNEYFPRSVAQANRELIDETGTYPIKRITDSMVKFLMRGRGF